jgi:hypothetical protein
MNARTIFRVLAVLVLVAVAIGIGAAVYNAGVTAGLAAAPQALPSGEALPVSPYWYGYGGPYVHGWGFGIFGIFFWILGIFLIIGLVRFAVGGGHRGGRGGWGDRRARIEEWHQELHRREAGGDQRPVGM